MRLFVRGWRTLDLNIAVNVGAVLRFDQAAPNSQRAVVQTNAVEIKWNSAVLGTCSVSTRRTLRLVKTIRTSSSQHYNPLCSFTSIPVIFSSLYRGSLPTFFALSTLTSSPKPEIKMLFIEALSQNSLHQP